MPVHDVDVQQVRPAALGGGNVLTESREISRQERRNQDTLTGLSAHLERNRFSWRDLKAGLGVLPQHDPRGNAGIRMVAHER